MEKKLIEFLGVWKTLKLIPQAQMEPLVEQAVKVSLNEVRESLASQKEILGLQQSQITSQEIMVFDLKVRRVFDLNSCRLRLEVFF